jgi:hypothetical protein
MLSNPKFTVVVEDPQRHLLPGRRLRTWRQHLAWRRRKCMLRAWPHRK